MESCLVAQTVSKDPCGCAEFMGDWAPQAFSALRRLPCWSCRSSCSARRNSSSFRASKLARGRYANRVIVA